MTGLFINLKSKIPYDSARNVCDALASALLCPPKRSVGGAFLMLLNFNDPAISFIRSLDLQEIYSV